MRTINKRKKCAGALTYFSLAGISDSTEISAANTLQTTLQGGTNIWSRLDRIHPVSPTSLNAASYCMKTLTQLTWVSSPTHGSTGVAVNGTSSYALLLGALNNSTSFPNFAGDQTKGHFSLYFTAVGTLSGTKYACGSQGFDNGDNTTFIALRQQSTSIVSLINGTTGSSFTASLDPSYSLVSRTASAIFRYRNGVQASTSAVAANSVEHPAPQLAIGANYSGVSASSFLGFTFAFFTIGALLDATDQLTLYNAIQAYQTSLGRNV